jgi:hypothetical protein
LSAAAGLASSGTGAGTPGIDPERTQELVALAVRLRSLAPVFIARLRELEAMAGPDTWRGRVAEVFTEELRDQVRYLEHLDDLVATVAWRVEIRASGLADGSGLSPP